MTKFKLEIEFEADSAATMAQLVEELASCVDDGDRIEITDWEIMEAESASPQLSPRTFLSRTLCSTELHICTQLPAPRKQLREPTRWAKRKLRSLGR